MAKAISSSFKLRRFCAMVIGILGLAISPGLLNCQPATKTAAPPGSGKPRVVITADAELDDNNTIIRAILYSSDFKIEGLVYASSGVHWKGDGKGTTQYIRGREYTRLGLCPCTSWRWSLDERFIDDIVDAYAKVYPNLKVHEPNYPSPAELRPKIKWGNVEFEGDYSKDTDGSNLIKSLLLDNQPGPLFVTAQGGQSTIARALKSIYDQYAKTPQWETIRTKVSGKLVIIPFGDQDGTYARYIKPNWPDVTEWQLRMIDFGYGSGLSEEKKVYLGAAWTRENVSSRGPLGQLYRVWGDGKQMVKGDRTDYFGLSGYTVEQLKDMGYMVWAPLREKGSFTSEGDTPTFLNLLANGLRAYENGFWGGWGGIRRTGEAAGVFGRGGARITPAAPDDPGVAIGLAPAGSNANAPKPADDATSPSGISAARGGNAAPGQTLPDGGRGPAAGGFGGFSAPPVSPKTAAVNDRFFAAAQNAFAARLKWSVTPKYSDANHEPKVSVKGPLEVTARSGSTVRLQGDVSDSDRNTVKVVWWQYNDAGSYPGDIAFSDPAALTTTFHVPDDAKPGQTIHVILEATDNGTPALTRYQRVIITVQGAVAGK
jgi:hypothetical protein